MRTLIAVSLLFFASVSIAWACPKKLQPTLKAYQIQQYGKSYVEGSGILPRPYDSEICEKIRYDMRYYYCRWGWANSYLKDIRRQRAMRMTKDGVPRMVERMMRAKPHHVGGKEAWERNVRGAWRRYKKIAARTQKENLNLADAAKGYYSAETEFEKNKCEIGIFAKGRNPFK